MGKQFHIRQFEQVGKCRQRSSMHFMRVAQIFGIDNSGVGTGGRHHLNTRAGGSYEGFGFELNSYSRAMFLY